MIRIKDLIWSASAIIAGSWTSGWIFNFWEVPLVATMFILLLLLIVVAMTSLREDKERAAKEWEEKLIELIRKEKER